MAYVQFAASADLFRTLPADHALRSLRFRQCWQPWYLIGGLSVLVPERKSEYLSIAPKSVICGTLVNLITGAIVGLVYLV